MEKISSIRTLTSSQNASDFGARKQPTLEQPSRVSSEVERDNKSELCISSKSEKPTDTNNQANQQRNFADFMKLGAVYASMPSQYFDQFSGM